MCIISALLEYEYHSSLLISPLCRANITKLNTGKLMAISFCLSLILFCSFICTCISFDMHIYSPFPNPTFSTALLPTPSTFLLSFLSLHAKHISTGCCCCQMRTPNKTFFPFTKSYVLSHIRYVKGIQIISRNYISLVAVNVNNNPNLKSPVNTKLHVSTPINLVPIQFSSVHQDSRNGHNSCWYLLLQMLCMYCCQIHVDSHRHILDKCVFTHTHGHCLTLIIPTHTHT